MLHNCNACRTLQRLHGESDKVRLQYILMAPLCSQMRMYLLPFSGQSPSSGGIDAGSQETPAGFKVIKTS